MPAPYEIPPSNDDDYLERLFGYIVIAREFKSLVIDLASEDISDREYFGEDLQQADVQESGRLTEDFQIMHGHYNVKLPDVPVINEVSRLDSAVLLSRPDGGRKYSLSLDDMLGGFMTVTYFEDMPLHMRHGSGLRDDDNILNRFSLTREASRGDGIDPYEMKDVQTLTTGIIAVKAAGRLVPVDECRCF